MSGRCEPTSERAANLPSAVSRKVGDVQGRRAVCQCLKDQSGCAQAQGLAVERVVRRSQTDAGRVCERLGRQASSQHCFPQTAPIERLADAVPNAPWRRSTRGMSHLGRSAGGSCVECGRRFDGQSSLSRACLRIAYTLVLACQPGCHRSPFMIAIQRRRGPSLSPSGTDRCSRWRRRCSPAGRRNAGSRSRRWR